MLEYFKLRVARCLNSVISHTRSCIFVEQKLVQVAVCGVAAGFNLFTQHETVSNIMTVPLC